MSGYAVGLSACTPMAPGFVNPNCAGNCPPGTCWTGHCDTTRNPAVAICKPDAGYVAAAAVPVTTPTTPVLLPGTTQPTPITQTVAPLDVVPIPLPPVVPIPQNTSSPSSASAYPQCPAEYPYGYLNPQGELVCLHAQDGAVTNPITTGQSSPVGAPVDTSTGYTVPAVVSASWWTDPTQALVDSIPNLYAVPIAAGLLYFVVRGMGRKR